MNHALEIAQARAALNLARERLSAALRAAAADYRDRGLTLREIGACLEISHVRVIQILREIDLLRRTYGSR